MVEFLPRVFEIDPDVYSASREFTLGAFRVSKRGFCERSLHYPERALVVSVTRPTTPLARPCRS